MLKTLAALWRGEIPLGRAFWEFAIVYGTTANIVATITAILAAAAGLPDVVVLAIFLVPLPYVLTAALGVLRSSNSYQGALSGDISRGSQFWYGEPRWCCYELASVCVRRLSPSFFHADPQGSATTGHGRVPRGDS